MSDAINTISDQAEIAGSESREIQFRVVQPGIITIHSVPAHHPMQSDSGLLGWLLLLRPGGGTAKRTKAKLTDTSMGLQYQATAADVAIPGNWTCLVSNGTNIPLTWRTDISGHITNIPSAPLQSASFDIDLLNLLLTEATTTPVSSPPSCTASAQTRCPAWASAQTMRSTSAPYFLAIRRDRVRRHR